MSRMVTAALRRQGFHAASDGGRDTRVTTASDRLPPPPALLSGASLFLDFDGTLVDLALRPELVVVDDKLRTLLGRLVERLDGRVALVSGRAVNDIIALVGHAPCTIVGSHGLEFRHTDGSTGLPDRPAGLDIALGRMEALAQSRPGVLVERKPLGAALHYRQVPEAGPECDALAAELALAYGLTLQEGKMMIELRTGGGDKGSAIRQLMALPPFASGRPVFLGDDITDEAGFAAAAALGGAGILIGADRPTAATYRLRDVAAVLRYLEEAAV